MSTRKNGFEQRRGQGQSPRREVCVQSSTVNVIAGFDGAHPLDLRHAPGRSRAADANVST